LPLIEKLPAMDEDQGIPIPRGNHLRRNDGLENAVVAASTPVS